MLFISYSHKGFLILTTCLLLLSCNSETDSGSAGVVTGKDSLEQGITPDSHIDSSFAGFYQSDVSCADCGAIQTLLLEPDGRFILEDQQRDSVHTKVVYKGSWGISDSLVMLYEKQAIIAKYGIVNGRLKTIERQGVPFSEETSRKLLLFKRSSIMENSAWAKKQDEGVSFYGIGTEPFWNIVIIKDSLIRIERIGEKPTDFKYILPNFSADSIIFAMADANNSATVTLVHAICSDGMSNSFYDYSVTVKLNENVLSGCGVVFEKDFQKAGGPANTN